jgi:hypothetical protein
MKTPTQASYQLVDPGTVRVSGVDPITPAHAIFPACRREPVSRLPRHEDKIAAYSCAQELRKQPWEDVPFRPGHRRRRRGRRRSNTGAEKSAADRLGIDLIPQRSDCESAKGLVPRPEGVPDLAHDDEVDACRVALEMLNPDMKGYGDIVNLGPTGNYRIDF